MNNKDKLTLNDKGQRHGHCAEYYGCGDLWREGNWKNGLMHGFFPYYDELRGGKLGNFYFKNHDAFGYQERIFVNTIIFIIR